MVRQVGRSRGAHIRTPGLARLLVCVMVIGTLTGCAGASTPYPNQREEGPDQGLLSGPEGEFVILERNKQEKAQQEQ